MGRRRDVDRTNFAPGMARDDRPRVYIRQTMDGRFSWRVGGGGQERGGHQSPGMAVNEAIEALQRRAAVIFWEGQSDG